MRIDFVTLFPEMVLPALQHSVLQRGVEKALLQFGAVNPRDFASDRHRTVDDSPFGGGPGMVMKVDVAAAALRALAAPEGTPIIVTDPTGIPFTQADAADLAASNRLVFVCGHYEGIDDRVRTGFATHVFSIGDFVLTGGELPALVMADAICRLVPGVLGKSESLEVDSHADGLLSAPQFTRPEVFESQSVPEVLRSGHHGEVAAWRRRQSLRVSRERRPDLFCRATLDKKDLDLLSS